MDETILALLAMLGIFALAGVGVLRIGLRGRREWRRREERERARASGTVVEFRKERRHVRRGHSYTGCTPVVEFRAEGRDFRLDAAASTQADEFAVGDPVEVLYDPDDPTRFHIEGRECEEKGDGRLIRMGLIWLACMLTAAVLLLTAHPLQWRLLLRRIQGIPLFHRSEGTVRQETEADGFRYILNDDGTVTIQGYSGSADELSVPLTLDGRLVSGLSLQAFSRTAPLKSVSVPGTLRSIPAGAFAACLGLREVTLGEGVTSVGALAFGMCPSLSSVTLPASLAFIDDSAFPEDCGAVFRVIEGSAAQRYCEKRGYVMEIVTE